MDISEGKLAALNGLSARLGCTIVSPLAADALEDLGKDFHGAFDRVLVDVPCSGTGTLRRAPEIKWRLQPSEIKALTAQQEKLAPARRHLCQGRRTPGLQHLQHPG